MHAVSRQLRVDAYGHDVGVTEICPGRVETDIFALVDKIDAAEAKKKYFADYAVEHAIGTPTYLNIGLIEITPTMQLPGGLPTGKRTQFPK